MAPALWSLARRDRKGQQPGNRTRICSSVGGGTGGENNCSRRRAAPGRRVLVGAAQRPATCGLIGIWERTAEAGPRWDWDPRGPTGLIQN